MNRKPLARSAQTGRTARTGTAAATADLVWRALQVTLLLLLAVMNAARAHGQEVSPERPVKLSDVMEPSLLFKTSSAGVFLRAPTLDTQVSIRVTGMIARAEVSQRFRNGTVACVEGVYVFPLPEDAAVDQLRMIVGDRIIEGEVFEREEAKKTYEQAKSEGRKASLLEQERPNVFTASIATIRAGEEVRVVLIYQQALRFDQGRFHLRFPMVVAPRYVPGNTVLASGAADPEPGQDRIARAGTSDRGAGGTGWAPDTDAVPDASRVTPPVLHPSHGPVHPVSLRIDLDAGFPLRRVASGTHALNARSTEGSHYSVSLSDEEIHADRDLELSWELDLGREPKAAAFTQTLDGQLYALLMVVPPASEGTPEARLPRETVFVIDTSGSMHGTSIDGAKRALTLALTRLGPEDRFNVIEFNSVTRRLFPDSRRALPDELSAANRWVERLEAQGGTEMLPALEAALAGGGETGAVRQVLFRTDGGVANEEQLFRYIREHLGASRLFTVGLGSAPNSHFMTKAAEFGRGTFTYVASAAEVETKMNELFHKLESPVLTNVDVRWDDASAETWPSKVPDLYAGEPLILAARLVTGNGGVTISGERAGQPWSTKLSLAGSSKDSGVDRLWARRKIAALMDGLPAQPGSERDSIRARVVQVALAHHLVSSFTSLVAVDVTPSGERGETCEARPIPVNLPAGWSYEHVFGEMPQTATSGRLLLLTGFAAIALGALLRIRSGGGAP